MTKKKQIEAAAMEPTDMPEPKQKLYSILFNRPIQYKHKDGDNLDKFEVMEPFGHQLRGFGLSDIMAASEEAYAKLFPKITKNIPVDYRLIKELDIDIFADLQAGLMDMLSDIIGMSELVKEHNGNLVLSLPHPIEKNGETICELTFPRRVKTSIVRGYGMQALRSREIDCLCDAASHACLNNDLQMSDFRDMRLSNLLGIGDVVSYWLGEKELDADFM